MSSAPMRTTDNAADRLNGLIWRRIGAATTRSSCDPGMQRLSPGAGSTGNWLLVLVPKLLVVCYGGGRMGRRRRSQVGQSIDVVAVRATAPRCLAKGWDR